MQHDAWILDCTKLGSSGECTATLTSRVADGTTRNVTLAVAPSSENYRGWMLPACDTRHLLLHRGEPETRRAVLVEYTPPQARAPGYTFALTVLHDATLVLATDPRGPLDNAWQRVAGGHRIELTPERDDGQLVAFDDAGDLLHHAGPMLGIGGRVSGDGAVRMRLEYEVAIDEWILPGIALDYDLEDGFVLAPRVELATPMLLVIPSFAVGLGLPIRLEADPAVGVRASVGLNFLSLGFVATFDIYPGSDPRVDSTLMFRFSL